MVATEQYDKDTERKRILTRVPTQVLIGSKQFKTIASLTPAEDFVFINEVIMVLATLAGMHYKATNWLEKHYSLLLLSLSLFTVGKLPTVVVQSFLKFNDPTINLIDPYQPPQRLNHQAHY